MGNIIKVKILMSWKYFKIVNIVVFEVLIYLFFFVVGNDIGLLVVLDDDFLFLILL